MHGTSVTALISQMGVVRVRGLLSEGPKRCAPWLHALAMDGVPEAQLCVGRMLLQGIEVTKSEVQALRWFKRAAAQGNVEAINMVGRCFENGWGCDSDVALAALHYHHAADAGYDWAQYNLGHLYLDGVGVKREAITAYRYYLAAATQGHARAMNLVGRCCEEGWGTSHDFAAAAAWYKQSAEAGYFRGQYNWASILLRCRRAHDAAAWFERAAVSGTPGVRRAVLEIAKSAASGCPVSELANRLCGATRY